MNSMNFKVVIPARYGSTRLPAKPLLDVGGRPMIQWVIQAAVRSGAEQVVVATDDERIATVSVDIEHPDRNLAVMTRVDHISGTDRIAEVAQKFDWSDETLVVNVQGDEPQMPPRLIQQVARTLAADRDAALATLSTPIRTLLEFMNPNVVKVVSDSHGRALYFSRAPIPWHRDGAPGGLETQTSILGAHRHLGIYAYRVGALHRLTALPPSSLELTEKLEQLRALQAGLPIAIQTAEVVPGVGVDTEHDLQDVRASFTRAQS
jgi:3-deoxy-manno-octulosonate cytidylyltransferase (CMP-KDO synthetase)